MSCSMPVSKQGYFCLWLAPNRPPVKYTSGRVEPGERRERTHAICDCVSRCNPWNGLNGLMGKLWLLKSGNVRGEVWMCCLQFCSELLSLCSYSADYGEAICPWHAEMETIFPLTQLLILAIWSAIFRNMSAPALLCCFNGYTYFSIHVNILFILPFNLMDPKNIYHYSWILRFNCQSLYIKLPLVLSIWFWKEKKVRWSNILHFQFTQSSWIRKSTETLKLVVVQGGGGEMFCCWMDWGSVQ